MTVDRAQVERLMKRCQIGCGGSQALSVAHEIMAECYGVMGALLEQTGQLQVSIAAVNAVCQRYEDSCFRDAPGKAMDEVRDTLGRRSGA